MERSLESAAAIFREALRDTVSRNTLLFISEGTLLVLVGLLAIAYPLFNSTALAAPLGWLLVLTAAVQGIFALGMRGIPQFAFQLLSVVLAFLIGMLMLRDPQQATQTIIVLIITYMMLQGVSRVMFGLSIRPLQHWEWVTASGALGVVLSMVLVASLPDPATWLVGLLVGIELIAEGAAIAMLAWRRNGTASDV